MFLHNFLPKTLLFYIFSSGAPCFVSCSFVFALLSLFCLSGAPFLILLRPFCLSGAPFLIYTFFSGHALSPKVGGPYVLPKTLFIYIFSSGAPCFVSCSFVFALLKPFCLSGGLFLYIRFFSGHALSPKVGGPYVFAQFSAKNTDSLHFFLGGPLFCFLFFCFCSFKAFLSLGGPFSYTSDFFPKAGGPSCFYTIFCQKHCFFTCFPRGPLVLFLVLLFLLF